MKSQDIVVLLKLASIHSELFNDGSIESERLKTGRDFSD